jgi:putative ABC transport system permease protein
LLLRSSLRHLARHPLLTALSVVGIALGVAVVVAIDLANESARHAFELSNEAVTGRSTHQVVGGPSGLPETFYVRLRRELAFDAAAPVVEGYATSPHEPGRALRILGVDPFAEAPFRGYVAAPVAGELRTLLTEPGAAVISTALARRLDLVVGNEAVLEVNGTERHLRIAAIAQPATAGEARAMEDLVLTDIATAQEWLDQLGTLTRIDLIVPDTPDGKRALARIAAACLGVCEIVAAAERSGAATQMTRAFTLNLRAMSFLALVVGMFLIYNTMTFSIVRRRPLLGTLRALGVSRREIFTLVLREAAVLAAPATALGLVLGIALATELVRLVTRTINDLYFVVSVRALHIELSTLLKGASLGIGATLLAAVAPAHEATRVPPTITLRRSSSETRLARRAGRFALAGVGLTASALILLAVSRTSLVLSYVALFAVLLAAALATPLATRTFAELARPLATRAFGVVGTMAARGIVTSLTRTSIALAALTIAVATTVGVGIMVASFRYTVVEWLESTLQSDIFIGPPNLVSRKGDGTLAPGVAARIARAPGVRAVNTIRNRRVRATGGDVDLHVPTFSGARPSVYRFAGLPPAEVFRTLGATDAIAVSEPFAFHRGVSTGAVVRIRTDHGELPFRVAAVYTDYASDEGGLMMARSTYERHFDDRGISALGVVAAPGVDLEHLRRDLAVAVGHEQAVTIRANRELREASLAIFDRTFVITRVLRLLSVGVAFVGILSALMALALERARELAVLRAIGLTPGQLARLVTLQTSLMGMCAGLLSIPLGIGLSLILVQVINKRSFGWTLALDLSPLVLLEALALAMVAALLAGIYPAWKMSRSNPAEALREE